MVEKSLENRLERAGFSFGRLINGPFSRVVPYVEKPVDR
jgi:hypothetical protein